MANIKNIGVSQTLSVQFCREYKSFKNDETDTATGTPGIRESGNPGIRESRNPGIRESEERRLNNAGWRNNGGGRRVEEQRRRNNGGTVEE